MSKHDFERNQQIFFRAVGGETMSAIGRDLGLSHQRISKICADVSKRLGIKIKKTSRSTVFTK